MSPNKDETRSQSVAGTTTDVHVFSLVLMYDGEIISALMMITNSLILVELIIKKSIINTTSTSIKC